MRSFRIVVQLPFFGHHPYLGKAVEHIGIQQSPAHGAVFPLDKCILRWFSRLDIDQPDSVGVAPLLEQVTDKFRPVICPDTGRLATMCYNPFQYPDNSPRG